jgi:hypothetical protein
MRALAATSGSGAQGKLTEAGEVVGEITLGGSLGFLLFVGILLPLAAAFGFLVLRRLAPGPVWLTGLVFGTILLGTVGIDDPLARDNVDFVILRPLWLAVAAVIATALLFGVTFSAVAARLDATLVGPAELRRAGWRQRAPYGSLVWLLNRCSAVRPSSTSGSAR